MNTFKKRRFFAPFFFTETVQCERGLSKERERERGSSFEHQLKYLERSNKGKYRVSQKKCTPFAYTMGSYKNSYVS